MSYRLLHVADKSILFVMAASPNTVPISRHASRH